VSLLVNNISYTKVGSGPHLCFLHGFCEDSSIWNYQIELLQEDFTCIAIDLPGFGDSSGASFTSIPEVAILIHTILIKEEATACVLFGHSLGGYIVGEYIQKYGEELSAAAVIHATLHADSVKKKANRMKSIDFIATCGTSEFFRLFTKGLVFLPNLGRLRVGLDKMVQRTSQKAITDGLLAMSVREDKSQELLRFKKPMLFLIGEEDIHYDASEIFTQVSLCDIAQVTIIKDVGHLSMLEKPHENLETIQEFLLLVDRISQIPG
jgi:pimeloyl-ACP methyl ester carboxylesterase